MTLILSPIWNESSSSASAEQSYSAMTHSFTACQSLRSSGAPGGLSHVVSFVTVFHQ